MYFFANSHKKGPLSAALCGIPGYVLYYRYPVIVLGYFHFSGRVPVEFFVIGPDTVHDVVMLRGLAIV